MSQPLGQVRSKILKQINDLRAENSLPPLKINEKLNKAAQWQSQDMADNGYMSHTDSLKRCVRDRVKAECDYTGLVGENVAVGFTPDGVVKGWKGSPGHLKNMLGKDYKEIGIGYVYKTFAEEKADADSFDFLDYHTNVFGWGEK